MKLNSKKFLMEDFPDAPSWMPQFLSSLNQFISEVYSGSRNDITVRDNLKQEIKEIKLENSSGNLPLKLKLKWPVMPKGLQIIKCHDQDGTALVGTPWVNWSYQDGGQLVVSSITNLHPNKTYNISILIVFE